MANYETIYVNGLDDDNCFKRIKSKRNKVVKAFEQICDDYDDSYTLRACAELAEVFGYYVEIFKEGGRIVAEIYKKSN